MDAPIPCLAITDDNFGFITHVPNSDEQKIKCGDDSLMKNGKRIRVSPVSSEFKLCIAGNPKNAKSELIEFNGMFKFRTRGSQVLTVGDYNVYTEMYDAKVIDEKMAASGEKYWFVIASGKNILAYNTCDKPSRGGTFD